MNNGAQQPPSEGTIENLIRDGAGAARPEDAATIRKQLRDAFTTDTKPAPEPDSSLVTSDAAAQPADGASLTVENGTAKGNPSGEGAGAVAISELADAWGQPLEQLYERVQIPLRDGLEPVSLGQLKDGFQDRASLDKREADLLQRQQQMEQRVAMETRAARALIDSVGASPEQIQRAHEVANERAVAEVQMLLQLAPDWNDSTNVTNDIAALEKHVSRFGLSTGNIHEAFAADHRWGLVLRDYLTLIRRVELAEKNAAREQKPVARKAEQPASGGGKAEWKHRPERIKTDRDRIRELFNR